MADANAIPSQPVVLNTPGGPSQTPATPPAQQPQSQGEVVQLGQFDPTRLSPELKAQYDSMYGDYQKKTTAIANERREWETQRAKFSDMEKKFSDMEKRLNEYAQQEQSWRQWAPLINAVNVPGRFEQFQRLARGEDLTALAQQQPQTQAAKANAAVQRLINMADDEYVTGAQLNEYLNNVLGQAVQTAFNQAKEGWQQYGQQAGQEILRQVFGVNQDYFKLFDQMFNLKLKNLYGLRPQENALFDEQRIIDEANRLNLRDLDLVWQMLYGDQRAQQAVQLANQSTQSDVEKKIQEAYQRGIQEERLRLHNADNPMINSSNGAPLPQFNNTPRGQGYGPAEELLRQNLLGKFGGRS